jgi:hypothetical protein
VGMNSTTGGEKKSGRNEQDLEKVLSISLNTARMHCQLFSSVGNYGLDLVVTETVFYTSSNKVTNLHQNYQKFILEQDYSSKTMSRFLKL